MFLASIKTPHSTRLFTTTLCFLCGLLFAASSFAQQPNSGPFFGQHAKGKWMIGVKAAQVDVNVENISNADAYGVVLGYEFAKTIGDLGGSASVEFEYLKSDKTSIVGLGDYEADLFNLFFSYRSAGVVYYKIKAGLSYSTLRQTSFGIRQDNEDVGLAGGLGLGLRLQDYGNLEIEYSQDASSNDLGLIGVNAFIKF